MRHKTLIPISWRSFVAVYFALAGTGTFAENLEKPTQDTILLAGEIILGPVKAGGSSTSSTADVKSNASRQKKAARDYRKEQDSVTTELLVVPEEEEGILSPRQAPGGTGASDSVTRARTMRQGETGGTVVLPPTGGDAASHAEESTATTSARRNRTKAAEYRAGDRGGSGVAVKGSDGMPIVDCSNVDNVSGRIGDDTRSGSVITLIQGSNQIKVRCR